MSVKVAGVNAKFDAPPAVGLRAIRSAAESGADVILVVEAKHLPRGLGLPVLEWEVVHDTGHGEARKGVAACFRKATMFVEHTEYHLGLRKNRYTLDRWVLTVTARRLRPDGKRWGRKIRYRVTHLVPKRGWEFWGGQMARVVAGRWAITYADFNKLPRAVQPWVPKARLFMRHIVGFAVRPHVRAGNSRAWRTPGLDHDIVMVELWPDR